VADRGECVALKRARERTISWYLRGRHDVPHAHDVADAVEPRVDGVSARLRDAVEDEVGGHGHERAELVALALVPQGGDLQGQAAKPADVVAGRRGEWLRGAWGTWVQ